MNFIETYKKGQKGANLGLPMGEGLSHIERVINGVQRGKIYGLAASPKAGKSTLADYGFVIQPYLYALKNNIPIEWIYFSWELGRVDKQFDFACFFLAHDYGITHIQLEDGRTVDGENPIELSTAYLKGELKDDNDKFIKVKKTVEDALKQVYEERLVPLFGEYAEDGRLISKGKIMLIEEKNNPTGIYKFLQWYAQKNGKFIKRSSDKFNRIIGYTPNNPDKFVIVISDHIRKLIPERGWGMKQTVDKYLEYSVEFRNWCHYTFLHIVHLNRNMTDTSRMRFAGDKLYPNSDDIKDTGNLSEDCNYLFTMFNPNDDRYNLNSHFGTKLRDYNKNLLHPSLRTIHLVESRHCKFPQHFSVNMLGGIKHFSTFKK